MSKQTDLHPVEYKIIAVIDNFQCTVPRIDFTPHLSIRSIDILTEEEQAVFSGPERLGRNIHFNPDGSIVRTRLLTFIQYQPASGRAIHISFLGLDSHASLILIYTSGAMSINMFLI